MRVVFKLFATLMEYLPAGVSGHEVEVEVEVGGEVTANGLIDRFSVPRGQAHLVLVNGVYAAVGERDVALQEGDVVAVWPPVAGG